MSLLHDLPYLKFSGPFVKSDPLLFFGARFFGVVQCLNDARANTVVDKIFFKWCKIGSVT